MRKNGQKHTPHAKLILQYGHINVVTSHTSQVTVSRQRWSYVYYSDNDKMLYTLAEGVVYLIATLAIIRGNVS